MAENETDERPLDEPSCLIVAALADGEPVDPNALRVALDDPAVREYLVDLIAVRAVAMMSDLPPEHWRARRSVRSRVAWMAAAASIAISLTAGYFVGQRAVQAAAPPLVETFVELGATSVAPKPTRVVSLRPGVNWTESAGEQ